MASIPVTVAIKSGRTSGKSEGKNALVLKEKHAWSKEDAVTAKRIIRSLMLQTSRKIPYLDESGNPTRHMIALKNRGHDPTKVVQVAEAVSLSDYERIIRDSFFKYARETGISDDFWICDIFPTESYIVVERGSSTFSIKYLPMGDGSIQFGEMVPIVWMPIPSDIADMVEDQVEDFMCPAPFEVTGISSDVQEGRNIVQWDIVAIKVGKSHNGWVWTPEVLEAAVREGLFDGVPAYNRTDAEHLVEAEAPQIGFISDAEFDPVQGQVKAKMNWYPEYYPQYLDKRFKEALRTGKKDEVLPEFSITGNVSLSRENMRIPSKINKIRSIDPVSEASSGGTAISIQEARNPQSQNTEPGMNLTKEQKAKVHSMVLSSKSLDELKKNVKSDNTFDVQEGDLMDIIIGVLEEKAPELFADDPEFKDELMKNEKLLGKLFVLYVMKAEEKGEKKEEPAPAPAPAPGVPVQEAKKTNDTGVIDFVVESILSNSGLTEKSNRRIRASLVGKDQVTVAEVREAVSFYKELESDFARDGMNRDVRVTRDNADNLKSAVVDFFFQNVSDHARRKDIREARGVPITVDRTGTIRSLKDLYSLLTGDSRFTFNANVAEAMDSNLATTLLTYGMQHRMLYEFMMSTMYQSYKSICNIVPKFDFKNNEAVQRGGFAEFGTVNKSTDYPTLTESGSTVESYKLLKRGGIFGIALEDIRNDDVSLVTSYPRELGRYAARMLSAFVWNLVTSNPNLSDGKAVIHDDHSNKLTAALSSTTLKQAIGKLQAQPYPNSTDVMGTRPANLIISIDPSQHETAYGLVKPAYGQNNDVSSWAQDMGIGVLTNPHASDTDDFYLVGDPNEVGLIELGFLDGMEEPQIQQAQTEGVGAWFTKHEAQWRIFHSYNAVWVGYRGIVGSLVP